MSFFKARLPKTKQAKSEQEPAPTASPFLPYLPACPARLISLEAHDRDLLRTRSIWLRGRKYTPSSLGRYVLHHMLRSRLKSFLTLAVALGFLLASAWIRQTMERSRLEVERLYDTTVVEADIVPADPSAARSNFVYLKTIDSVLNSGFVKSSVLEAETVWFKIKNLDSQDVFPGKFPVYAYDSPEAFNSGLADPGSLSFASGWDMNLFAAPRTIAEIRKDGLPALFPASLLEMLQLESGPDGADHRPIQQYLPLRHRRAVFGEYSRRWDFQHNSSDSTTNKFHLDPPLRPGSHGRQPDPIHGGAFQPRSKEKSGAAAVPRGYGKSHAGFGRQIKFCHLG